MKIITPSYKRAGKIKAIEYFGAKLIIACHEFEQEEYKIAYPKNKLMIIPDTHRGNMAKVRNFILRNCDTTQLVMVDDDFEGLGYHENGEQIEMPSRDSLAFIKEGFRMAEELGTVLWGVNLQSDPKFYRAFSPVSFLSPVLGPFCCINTKGINIEYDERLGLNEDYDFAIQVIYHYRKILRMNKYYYKAGHLDESGGCGSYRTLKREREQAEIMIKKWGKVVKYDFKKSTNPIIRIPLRGI